VSDLLLFARAQEKHSSVKVSMHDHNNQKSGYMRGSYPTAEETESQRYDHRPKQRLPLPPTANATEKPFSSITEC
jgi:hypothetical protein